MTTTRTMPRSASSTLVCAAAEVASVNKNAAARNLNALAIKQNPRPRQTLPLLK
jgi:hypothetical protein